MGQSSDDKTPGEPVSDAGAGRGDHAAGMFGALKLPVYRLYFGALIGQMAAMNMQMVARSWFM